MTLQQLITRMRDLAMSELSGGMPRFYNAEEILILCEAADAQLLEIENLKMVCRRLAVAKSLGTRDKIASQCRHLFAGKIAREVLRKVKGAK